jgi:hypothetical protein
VNAIRVDKYTLIKAEDNGEYGWKLMEGWENQAGEFKPNFCDREFKKGSGKKSVPVTIKLGDKSTAISALKMILAELEGKTTEELDDRAAPF